MSASFGNASNGERRGRTPPIPPGFEAMLNQDQKNALRNVENFGWQMAFVRRPLFDDPIFVVTSPDHQRYAILESSGEVNMEPEIVVRH